MPATPSPERPSRLPREALVSAIAAGLIAFGAYLRTLHPGVGPSLDSIELQIAALVQGIIHPPGSPQYLVLGRLMMSILPGPSMAFRLNLFSALCASVAVAFVHLSTYRLTRSVTASALASLSLALSPRFWYQASITELYAVNSLYLAAVFYLLLAWRDLRWPGLYWAAALIYALGFGNHVLLILFLPVYLYIVLTTDRAMLLRPRNLLLTIGVVLLGMAQYAYIPLRAAAEPPFCNYCPGPVPGFWRYLSGPLLDYVTGGPFKGAIFGLSHRDILHRIPQIAGQFNEQFFPWGYALGVIGLWEVFRRRAWLAWGLALGILTCTLFVAGYNVPDWHDFLTPAYVLFAPLLAFGSLAIWDAITGPIFDRLLEFPLLLSRGQRGPQVIRYGAVALVVLLLVFAFYTNIVYVNQRDNVAFERDSRTLLSTAEPGAWLLMPSANSPAFYYSWAVRYVSLAEALPAGLTVIASPEINPPPGPAPYYVSWAEAAPLVAAQALVDSGIQLFLLDASDSRTAEWGLLPVCTIDRAIAGYEVVAVRTEGEDPVPLVPPDRWESLMEQVVYAGEEAACE